MSHFFSSGKLALAPDVYTSIQAIRQTSISKTVIMSLTISEDNPFQVLIAESDENPVSEQMIQSTFPCCIPNA